MNQETVGLKVLFNQGVFVAFGMDNAEALKIIGSWARKSLAPRYQAGVCAVTGITWAFDSEQAIAMHTVPVDALMGPRPQQQPTVPFGGFRSGN